MIDEDDISPGHDCGGHGSPVTARRFSWWFLPAMIFNLTGNLARAGTVVFTAWMTFYEELGHCFYAHGLYKQSKEINNDAVDSFRKQLTKL